MSAVLSFALAVVLLGGWAFTSYLVALLLVPGESCSARWSAAVLAALGQAVAFFLALSAIHGFRLEVALPLFSALVLAAGWVARRRSVFGALEADLRGLASAFRELGSTAWLGLAAVPVVLRVLRGAVVPPLGWDALTYHLVKAGQWVQASGFVALDGPDGNRRYDFFAPYGDVLWSWAMLAVRNDALLPWAGLAVWLAVVLAAYACARALEVSRRGAFVGALAVALTPSAASLVTSAFVDNTVLALFLFAALFAVRALEGRRAGDAVLAGIALGLLAGTKTTGIAILVPGILVVLVATAWTRFRDPRWLTALAGAGFAAPHYVRAWLATGNPLYPFQLPSLAALFGSSAGAQPVAEAGAPSAAPGFSFVGLLGDLATPFTSVQRFNDLTVHYDHVGLGPGLLVLLPLGIAGAVLLARRKPVAVLVIAGMSLALVATQLIGEAHKLWMQPLVTSTQRYVLGVVGALGVLASTLERRWARGLLAGVAICGGLLSLPRGISGADLEAVRDAWPAFAVFAVAGVAGVLLARRRRGYVAVAIELVGVIGFLGELEPVREADRYLVYRSAAAQTSFDATFLHPYAARAWPIWAALDDGREHRIAVAAGFDATANNWFRYPLLGKHLQNKVLYVPPTDDGRVVDYSNSAELERHASFEAWLRALVRDDVDTVVVLAPLPIESEWIERHPELFRLAAASEDSTSGEFVLERERARAFLENVDRSR